MRAEDGADARGGRGQAVAVEGLVEEEVELGRAEQVVVVDDVAAAGGFAGVGADDDFAAGGVSGGAGQGEDVAGAAAGEEELPVDGSLFGGGVVVAGAADEVFGRGRGELVEVGVVGSPGGIQAGDGGVFFTGPVLPCAAGGFAVVAPGVCVGGADGVGRVPHVVLQVLVAADDVADDRPAGEGVFELLDEAADGLGLVGDELLREERGGEDFLFGAVGVGAGAAEVVADDEAVALFVSHKFGGVLDVPVGVDVDLEGEQDLGVGVDAEDPPEERLDHWVVVLVFVGPERGVVVAVGPAGVVKGEVGKDVDEIVAGLGPGVDVPGVHGVRQRGCAEDEGGVFAVDVECDGTTGEDFEACAGDRSAFEGFDEVVG